MARPTITINGKRRCARCEIEKDVSEFGTYAGGVKHNYKTYYKTYCKECFREYWKENKKKNYAEYRKAENARRKTVEYKEKQNKWKRERYRTIGFTDEQKERHKMNVAKYVEKNKKEIYQKRIQARRALRAEFIKQYGGKCECCGESAQEFLTLEHKNGGGAKHRKLLSTESLLRRMRKEGWKKTGEYGLLCFNCNMAIGAFGYCPHKK